MINNSYLNTEKSRRVIATAIEDDFIILEDETNGNKIPWPLNQIPKPFNLGTELKLILSCNNDHHNTHPATTSNELDDDAEKRKLLEELIN